MRVPFCVIDLRAFISSVCLNWILLRPSRVCDVSSVQWHIANDSLSSAKHTHAHAHAHKHAHASAVSMRRNVCTKYTDSMQASVIRLCLTKARLYYSDLLETNCLRLVSDYSLRFVGVRGVVTVFRTFITEQPSKLLSTD